MDSKQKAKIGIDLIFCATFAVIPFFNIISYLKFIRVGLFGFQLVDTEEFPFPVAVDGGDCPDIIFLENCDMLNAWANTGIAFYCIGGLSLVVAGLGILNLFNASRKWNIKILSFWQYHYVYPLGYSIALSVYWYFSKVFNTDPPSILGLDYQMKYELGLYLMICCEAIAIISAGIFTCSETDPPEIVRTPLLS